jgi:hypothetical protein
VNIWDECYLIVTHRAADQFRNMVGENTHKTDIRNILVSALRGAPCVREAETWRGLEQTFRCRLRCFPGMADFVLVLGHRGGSPQMAPDGKKRCAFLASIELAESAVSPC